MTQDQRSNRMKPNCLSGRGVDARAATATVVAEPGSTRWIQTMMIAWRRGRRSKSPEAAPSRPRLPRMPIGHAGKRSGGIQCP